MNLISNFNSINGNNKCLIEDNEEIVSSKKQEKVDQQEERVVLFTFQRENNEGIFSSSSQGNSQLSDLENRISNLESREQNQLINSINQYTLSSLNGGGKKTDSNVTIYDGEFKNGYLNGKGKKTEFGSDSAVLAVYEGEFEGDMLNGKGKITFSDGTIFQGEFKDDKLNGQGEKIYPVYQVSYVGEFKDNELVHCNIFVDKYIL